MAWRTLPHSQTLPWRAAPQRDGWRVLDVAMTLHGPGLLDLAAWSGLRLPADRGGLPAERWALGWHRVHAAHWLLTCALTGVDGPDAEARHIAVLRRQLTSAHDLLVRQ